MKVVQKISIRLVLLQILFLYLFSQAASRLSFNLNADGYECLFINGPEMGRDCMEHFKGYKIGDLIAQPIYWMLYGLLIGAVIIGIVNWRKKVHFLNLPAILVLYVLLFFSGVFKVTKDIDALLFSFGGIFTHKFGVMNFIVVQIYFISGLVLLWLSVRNKLTSKN